MRMRRRRAVNEGAIVFDTFADTKQIAAEPANSGGLQQPARRVQPQYDGNFVFVLLKMMHRKLVEPPGWQAVATPEACALCERPIPAAQRDAHHLVPRMKGGKLTVAMHRICHRHVHALFSETELARSYSTPQALLSNAEIRKFVEWVRTKPDDFYERTRRPARRR